MPDLSTAARGHRPAAGRAARPAPGRLGAVAAGGAAMVLVGGSVATSGVLASAPMLTAEAVRYTAACLVLVLFARVSGQRLAVPRGPEWQWLSGVALTGLVLFNIALVQGSRHAEPAALGVAVACVPPLLAVLGPRAERSRPGRPVLAGALVVTCGAVLVTGVGRTDAAGVAWAAVVCGCDAAFTLLAMPVLGRHGPWGVSVHATWIAAVLYAGAGLIREGPAAMSRLRPEDWLAVGYLAVSTAVAFVLWYSAVGRLGAGRAGLLGGVAPIAAAVTGVLLGGPVPGLPVWAGVAVVLSGLALGLRAGLRAGARGRRYEEVS
ncbi:MAG TPA: DMT family transporter [Streptosporangiaceae bacterium]|nr:DMT family transporter [Streptosporangiaceae bacterium]